MFLIRVKYRSIKAIKSTYIIRGAENAVPVQAPLFVHHEEELNE
jgi:hypothetical protein